MPFEPHHVDRHVGQRLKTRRLVLGLSQERLGELLGLTFQQIQKYERGANRIGASRLYEAALALEVDVAFFFAELPDTTSQLAPGRAPGPAEDGVVFLPEVSDTAPLVGRRDALELLRAFERIGDLELRQRLVELAKAVAGCDGDHPAGP